MPAANSGGFTEGPPIVQAVQHVQNRLVGAAVHHCAASADHQQDRTRYPVGSKGSMCARGTPGLCWLHNDCVPISHGTVKYQTVIPQTSAYTGAAFLLVQH